MNKKCPICNESLEGKQVKKQSEYNLNDTSVTDSRVTKNGSMIRRRRLCMCGNRFTTYEIVCNFSSMVF